MLADLSLDNNADDFISYFLKVTDGHTGIRCLVASKDRLNQVIAEVGSNPGLYVLQAEDSTLYVGQSKDLQARLKAHKSTNKIDFCRGMAMARDQSLAQYLDYGEAKLYVELQKHGFKLEQSSLSSSLPIKEARLLARDKDHVKEANSLLNRFLKYIVALGLSKPVSAEVSVELLVPTIASPPMLQVLPAIDAAELSLVELSRQKRPPGLSLCGPS